MEILIAPYGFFIKTIEILIGRMEILLTRDFGGSTDPQVGGQPKRGVHVPWENWTSLLREPKKGALRERYEIGMDTERVKGPSGGS